MTQNPSLAALSAAGVSVWLDELSRDLLQSGKLQQLIDTRSVVGVTTNPSTFERAPTHGCAYDGQIAELMARGADIDTAVRTAITDDVWAACDVLRPQWEASDGVDGRVSIRPTRRQTDQKGPGTIREAVDPLRLRTVAATVFTHPEVAAVGVSQTAIDDGSIQARFIMLPLKTNARAKMSELREGFVKLFCRQDSGVVIGGVVVAPIASELTLPIAMAVQNRITVDDLAHTLAIYPSLSGSVTEAARRLIARDDLN